MTYSLLPARAATPERFAHADPQHLDWVKRRETFLRQATGDCCMSLYRLLDYLDVVAVCKVCLCPPAGVPGACREVSHWAPSVLCLQRVANDAWPLIADELRRRGYEGQLLMDQRDVRYILAHSAIAQLHAYAQKPWSLD